MLAAMAAVMGHTPQEAMDIFSAPRPPRDPPDPKDPKAMKTAADLEVEIPQPAPVQLSAPHAMHAIIKAQHPKLNRKQRRQMANRMQAQETNRRAGINAKTPRG
jgi:hypothetical protein